MENRNELSDHSGRYIWNVEDPKNVAVHFGNCHQHHDDPGNIKSSLTPTNKLQFTTSVASRSKFTRHMIRKLEKLNGSIHYTSQLLSFLNEVVEPPEFSIDLPSTDDCTPENDPKASYPLWYKNPEKIFKKITDDIASEIKNPETLESSEIIFGKDESLIETAQSSNKDQCTLNRFYKYSQDLFKDVLSVKQN